MNCLEKISTGIGCSYFSGRMKILIARFQILMLLTVVFGISACKKVDELPPNIQVQFPSAGASYSVPDTVTVGLIVTDETELTNVEVKLIGPGNILASNVASIDPIGNRFEGSLSVAITDKYLPTGDYSIHVRARDGNNERFKFIDVNVNELAKRRRGIVAMVGNSNATGIFYIDSLADVNPLVTLSQDPGFLCVDNRNDQIIVTGNTYGDILALDATTGLQIWSNSGFHQPPQPTYLGLTCDDGDAYVAMYDHEVRGLNSQGTLIMNQDITSAFRPGEIYATDDLLLVEQNEVGASGNWMFRYFKENAVQQELLEIPFNVVSICPFDEESVMLFGNDETGQARVLRYYFADNYTWEPRDLPDGQVNDAVATSNGRYAISHSDGLLFYTYSPNFLETADLNSGLSKVRYDEDRGTVLVVDDIYIREIGLNGAFVESHLIPGSIVDFDIHYTK